MSTRPKRLPRLWCAMQGLLPVEACLAAQRAELAWPAKQHPEAADSATRERSEELTDGTGNAVNNDGD